jgi:DNA primase
MRPHGAEYKSPCPICGGTDRFVVKRTELWRWYCRQALNHKPSGDVITLIQHMHGKSFVEACDYLGIQLERRTATFSYNRRQPVAAAPAIRTSTEYVATNDEVWQMMARQFIALSLHAMSDGSEHSNAAQNYIRQQRKLAATTQWQAQLGYNPKTVEVMWGSHPVKLWQGIVIPWRVGMGVLRINVRRNGDPKYLPIAGSGTGLYNVAMLKPGCDAVLVEGEFDAMSILDAQGRNPRYIPVASGSTTHARTAQWIARLAMCRRVAIAYDTDEAGEHASEWWLRVLPNAYRLRPLAHDVSDMHQSGMDIVSWLDGAL